MGWVHAMHELTHATKMSRSDVRKFGRQVRKFLANCDPSKTYILYTRGHCCCIINGCIADFALNYHGIIIDAWEITK